MLMKFRVCVSFMITCIVRSISNFLLWFSTIKTCLDFDLVSWNCANFMYLYCQLLWSLYDILLVFRLDWYLVHIIFTMFPRTVFHKTHKKMYFFNSVHSLPPLPLPSSFYRIIHAPWFRLFSVVRFTFRTIDEVQISILCIEKLNYLG